MGIAVQILMIRLLLFVKIIFLFGHITDSSSHHSDDFIDFVDMILRVLIMRFSTGVFALPDVPQEHIRWFGCLCWAIVILGGHRIVLNSVSLLCLLNFDIFLTI